MTLANLPEQDLPENHGRFRFLVADGCDLSRHEDNSFHLVHSNSVIEHVGEWSRMKQFASEVARVGQGYFVQTPHYWFPVEPHCLTPCFHWLPRPWRLALVQRFALGNWPRAAGLDDAVRIVDSARLLNRPMMAQLFPGASLLDERLAGLPKSIIAIRPPSLS
ncbi:class I SAM-dependent methyltransferase [Ferrimonas sediminicola]|uniref:Class I SAM-dependent methyltransferase n=1 Tax=Ferrimonas sediminicola TaxID=2569538 RepID=A0A4U1BAG6_9GAMM|nr:class I SAM-dependent methyltransferase [Ferrimonas sediminicola]